MQSPELVGDGVGGGGEAQSSEGLRVSAEPLAPKLGRRQGTATGWEEGTGRSQS